jgi:hypothetical protein
VEQLITASEFARRAGIPVRTANALFRYDLVIGQLRTVLGQWRAPLSAVQRYLRGERPDSGDTALMQRRRRDYWLREG